MGTHYTGVFEMLGNGLGFGILFGLGALAVLWGVLYVLDRVFPEKKDEEAHMLRLLESNVEALPKPKVENHRKAA
jgi:hypothetical protein